MIMKKSILITKASGKKEPFSVDKLKRSLKRSGADDKMIEEIANDIELWLDQNVTTKKIYTKAFTLLRKKKRAIAARYSLKKAIMELGPSGYPFEYLIGQVFKHWGYHVEIGRIVQGHCVTHEVDILYTGDKEQGYVECKYYNSSGKYANVQVPLYIRSRVNDIINKHKTLPQFAGFSFHGWVVTNTRFTADAEKYGLCCGLNLMGWDFPQGNSLKENIEKYTFFPITVLTELTKAQKAQLLEKGIVLCRQLKRHPNELYNVTGVDEKKQKKVMQEVDNLCGK